MKLESNNTKKEKRILSSAVPGFMIQRRSSLYWRPPLALQDDELLEQQDLILALASVIPLMSG